MTEPSIVCFVPKDNSANSPGFPPKNSAGTKDTGCLILLLYSIKELIWGRPVAIVSHFFALAIFKSFTAFFELLLFINPNSIA